MIDMMGVQSKTASVKSDKMAKISVNPLKNFFKKMFLSEYFVLYLCIVYFIVVSLITPNFFSVLNIQGIISNMLPLLLLAIGQTFVLITGGIDLSLPSIASLASVLGASIMAADTGLLGGSSFAVPVAIIVMIFCGLLIGWINGICITKFHMPPFIVTLTLMLFISGVAVWYTKSTPIYGLPDSFLFLSNGYFSFIAVLLITIFAHFIMNSSLFGKRIFAIGTNMKASKVSGVPVVRSTILVYVISGLFAVLGAIFLTARLETGSPNLGDNMTLDVIGAAIIGGTSLFGGKGKVLWTVFGVLFIVLISNSLNLLNFTFFTIMIIKGLLILLAAVIDSVRTRMLNR
jgi:ribose/xylose/arabinose/galactoside ABC-type transport system permease subunit